MVSRTGSKLDLVDEAIRELREEYNAGEEFNEYFDGDEMLNMGLLEFRRSEVLFWLDKEVYLAEKRSWEDASLWEKYKPAYEELDSNGQISIFRDLIGAVESNQIVPVVGAGLSKPMNMPLWSEALHDIHCRICSPLDQSVADLIEAGHYLEAAEELANKNQVVFENYIRTTFRVQDLAGPIAHLPRLARGCVVTTNLDDAIEQVFRKESIVFDGYMHGAQEHNFFPRLVRNQKCLLKLHGDSDNAATYVLRSSEYQAAYRDPFDFHLPLPKALRQIYVSRSLLFLGCSLNGDKTIELFEFVNSQKEYELPRHFAILPVPPGAADKTTQETRLLEAGIQPIWYATNRHEFLDLYLSLALHVADGTVVLNSLGDR